MERLEYSQYAREFLEQLPHGAFLTVQSENHSVNTMTIGWGTIGFIWQRPIMTVLVRHSRYTYQLLKSARDFTVSVPLDDSLKSALAVAGSRSGRDTDKFKTCGLTSEKSRTVSSPYIGECGLVFECSILYRQPMDLARLDPQIRSQMYDDGDFHEIYCGEIKACYKKS